MKCTILADTHGQFRSLDLPGGDLLIHAGDITRDGHPTEFYDFANWCHDQAYETILVIAGNHDVALQHGHSARPDCIRAVNREAHYLEDDSVTVNGYQFYGSPWTPQFMNWAFMKNRDALEEVWSNVPETTDVLITHGPPYGCCDRVIPRDQTTVRPSPSTEKHVGDHHLRETIELIQPNCHVFGHIHEGYGTQEIGSTRAYNVSILDKEYQLNNDPITIRLEDQDVIPMDDSIVSD